MQHFDCLNNWFEPSLMRPFYTGLLDSLIRDCLLSQPPLLLQQLEEFETHLYTWNHKLPRGTGNAKFRFWLTIAKLGEQSQHLKMTISDVIFDVEYFNFFILKTPCLTACHSTASTRSKPKFIPCGAQCACESVAMDIDLLHPNPADEKRQHKPIFVLPPS